VDERKLVAEAKRGDERALENLVKKYREPIYRLLYRLVGDYEKAADLTQEVFVKMWRNLSRLREEASFKGWLYRIAINEAKNSFRKQKGKKQLPLSPNLSTFDDPEQSTLDKEKSRVILAAIGKLPEKQRLSLTLRLWEEMDFAEIAEVMGCAAATARVNYHFALINLKKIMGKG
jgi:RNA polymerase sigma-70 factor (ECF subfamily)